MSRNPIPSVPTSAWRRSSKRRKRILSNSRYTRMRNCTARKVNLGFRMRLLLRKKLLTGPKGTRGAWTKNQQKNVTQGQLKTCDFSTARNPLSPIQDPNQIQMISTIQDQSRGLRVPRSSIKIIPSPKQGLLVAPEPLATALQLSDQQRRKKLSQKLKNRWKRLNNLPKECWGKNRRAQRVERN